MATLTGHMKRLEGKDVSSDILSHTYKGEKWVPYQIIAGASGSNIASAFRGVVLISRAEIDTYGYPDNEQIRLTLT